MNTIESRAGAIRVVSEKHPEGMLKMRIEFHKDVCWCFPELFFSDLSEEKLQEIWDGMLHDALNRFMRIVDDKEEFQEEYRLALEVLSFSGAELLKEGGYGKSS